jgi:hypothetical protein
VALRSTFGARPATRLHPQGEKPADLCRFRAPTKYELAINLKTAKRAPRAIVSSAVPLSSTALIVADLEQWQNRRSATQERTPSLVTSYEGARSIYPLLGPPPGGFFPRPLGLQIDCWHPGLIPR